jgi:hypothetical protein
VSEEIDKEKSKIAIDYEPIFKESREGLDRYLGQGTFKDTGRKSEGYGEAIDSITGAPARTLIQEAQRGNLSWDAVKRVFSQIGADPKTAPTGYDIASEMTDDPWLGTLLATAIDFGVQLPGAKHISPGVIGEIRGVKNINSKIADAVEAFAQRGKSALSTETKIAQMHGKTGEVRLFPGESQPLLETKVGEKRFVPTTKKDGPRFWHSTDDHSYTDEAKNQLDRFVNRFGELSGQAIGALKGAVKNGPDHLPYVGHDVHGEPGFRSTPVPNFSLKPKGVIGEPRIQGMSAKEADPLSWMDDKFGATKQLLLRHKSIDMPAQINTSSDLIAKKDYMKLIPRGSTVNFYMLSPNEHLNRILFPGNASQKRIERAAQELEKYGFKVNRVYPKSAEELISSSEKAYGHNIEKQTGSLREDLVKKLNNEMSLGYPDNYAHGGTVVPGYANGGVAAGINMLPSEADVDSFLSQPTQGGAMPSMGEVDQWLQEDRFSGIGGQALAGLTGAAAGLTLGASNVLLTKSGAVSPETLSQLEEEPAYLAGEIASAFAPTGAASLIGKAGKATYQGLKALGALKKADKVTKLTAKVLAHGAGSAVEGALYAGTANTLNEYALGDPDLNAEKILSNYGHGAIFGGLLGSGIKAAAIGAPPALRAAKDAITKIKNLAGGSGYGEKSLATRALGAIGAEEKTIDAFLHRAMKHDPEDRLSALKDATDNLNALNNNIQTTVKDLNSSIRPAEADALIGSANKQKVLFATQDVIDEMNKVHALFESRPAMYSKTAAAVVEDIRDDLVGQLKSDKPIDRFKALRFSKQKLQSIGWGTPTEQTILTKPVIKELSSFVDARLSNPDIFGMAGASLHQHDDLLSKMYNFIPPKGKRGNEQAREFKKLFLTADNKFDQGKMERFLKVSETPKGERAKELLNNWFELQKILPDHLENTYANVPNTLWDKAKLNELRSSLAHTSDNIEETQVLYEKSLAAQKGERLGVKELLLGGVGAYNPLVAGGILLGDMALKPIEYINKLSTIERAIGKTTEAIEKGSKAIFSPSLKTLGKTKGPLTRESTKEEVEDYKQFRDDLSSLHGNPMMMMDSLSGATEELFAIAPATAEGLQRSLMNANQFLASKLPSTMEINPFDEEMEPSASEVSAFNRYRNIIEEPTLALDQIADGTLMPETIETLATVYPGLYNQMKAELLNQATTMLGKKEKIPYQTKLMISMFLGQPVETSLSLESILSNQMAFAQVNAQEAQGQVAFQGKPSKAGMGKITLGKRSELDRGRMES